MIHSRTPTPNQDHRSLVWMQRNDLILAILHAEDAGFGATADALMELVRLLEERDSNTRT